MFVFTFHNVFDVHLDLLEHFLRPFQFRFNLFVSFLGLNFVFFLLSAPQLSLSILLSLKLSLPIDSVLEQLFMLFLHLVSHCEDLFDGHRVLLLIALAEENWILI